AKNDRGRVSAELPMTDLILVLSRGAEQQAAFDKFVASQYDPNSPNFHHWLEPEEVGTDFGPSQADIDAVTGWLTSKGFSVDEVSKNRLTVRFSGTAGLVESAFHTEMHNLEVKGEQHIANMSDPQIPAALGPVVVGVKALHNFFPRPLHKMGSQVARDARTGKWKRAASETDAPAKAGTGRPVVSPLMTINDPNNCSGSSCYPVEDVVPYDFAAIYNVTPLWTNNINGAGQTIAIAGTSDIVASDVSTFRSAFGLPAVPSFKTIVANGTDPGQCTKSSGNCTLGDLLENTLDVEWSGAVAPGANLVLVVAGATSQTTDTLYASESYIVQNKTASIMNVSYGLCELGNGTAGNVEYYNLWQTAASEGIAAFVATGDSGSPACDQGGDSQYGTPYAAEYGLSVSGLASTPFNTAVGGTDLNWGSTAAPYWNSTNNGTTLASAIGYMPEVPWNDTCASPLGASYLEYVARQVGVSGVTDAETACNFVAAYWQTIYYDYDVDLSGFVDTVGGGGGKSGCVSNNSSSVASCTQPAGGTVTGSIPVVNDGWPKPSWQANVTGIPSDGVRDIPDISFFASNGFLGSAYLVCVSKLGPCTYNATTENRYQEVGGTSVSSPAMAGVMALINQKAGSPQGSPNKQLYALAAKQNYASCSAERGNGAPVTSSSCFFNDIDTGTNAMPCDAGGFGNSSPNCTVLHSGDGIGILSGYSATAGYDPATGLGSLNVANVVNNWPSLQAPQANLSTTSLNFGSILVPTKSISRPVTLTNTGNAALSLNGSGQGISITGANASAFSQTNNCPASMAAGAYCTINVSFAPPSKGQYSATLQVADNASPSPQKVSLAGVGAQGVLNFSPIGYTFPSTVVGSTNTWGFTVTNNGDAAAKFSSITMAGSGAKSFSVASYCPASLAAGSSCSLSVTFKPTAAGTVSAQISLADNGMNSPQIDTVYGTGTLPQAVAPKFNPGAGSYTGTQSVSITEGTTTATVYYTTDGTTPSATHGTKYTVPISVSKTETLMAIAVATGYTNSTVTTAKYTITPVAATPQFTLPGGSYKGTQTVGITEGTATATVYYTTDGTTPSATHGTKYTKAISVSKSETIEAIAIATGYANSTVAKAVYTIK
ncbi:MAG: choice-of-anchor D domain-containing protein, partial [Terracidiphilus sp.]